MASLISFNLLVKIILVGGCLALVQRKPSDALLLSNLMGCNSIGCRLSALENDVAQLKQQVARLDPSGMVRPNNMQNMNQPFNPNMNQNMLPNQGGQGSQQQQNSNQQNANRVNYANPEYPTDQLRRVSANYPVNQPFYGVLQ